MMKDTGIIRRVDDLGRVAIPKELRRQIKIEEGDLLIYSIDTKAGTIEIKKCNPAPLKGEKTVEQKANDWIMEHEKEMLNESVSFSMNGKITLCVCLGKSDKIELGRAICSPKDKYISAVGMIISYCRARDKKIPDFIEL